MRELIGIFLKGAAMGAANVIPGVSGGTIAFITGIYERLIGAIKSCDLTAVRLLIKFDLAGLFRHVDARFLIALGAGVLVSILSLARLLEYLFGAYPVFLWAFFFGLILASIWFVARTVRKWGPGPVVMLLVGTAVAVGVALLKPAAENANLVYIFACGIVAISSMIIPGLSGSFVLILMGNYMLILAAISDLNLGLLIPFAFGCGVGILALSHLLAWVFKRYHDAAVALITGFILGSLLIIWPWKSEVLLLNDAGAPVIRKGEEVIQGYSWFWPEVVSAETGIAVGLMVAGVVIVALMERMAAPAAKS